ncbi:YfcE family phosphodiesterase, partial [Streptococcus agalactiae]|nr:YfcE family phosphodiesterase [Streptococcus agalactiae]
MAIRKLVVMSDSHGDRDIVK